MESLKSSAISHAPENYQCPFCRVARGIEDEHVVTRQADVVFQNEKVTAFISSRWWPRNPGHVLIIPNEHHENIYKLPEEIRNEVYRVEAQVALALKQVYGCEGLSSRKHSEPAGNQEVWHAHLHLFPRYKGDNLYLSQGSDAPAEQRAIYAEKLREYFEDNPV